VNAFSRVRRPGCQQ